MTKGITVKRQFHVRRERSNRQQVLPSAKRKFPIGRVPRISRLMALAIRFDQLIRDGVVEDQAQLARLGHVSRARLTQITNLLALAPIFRRRFSFCRQQMTDRNWFSSGSSERLLPNLAGVNNGRYLKAEKLDSWRSMALCLML